ncbi:MAG: DUF3793 family protein [Lachnospiraceae bacterium]|nr:DUF3793 family protein [Lachnospiraceae bacterium]
MGTEAIGQVLGQQCAPVIAGVKPSNLLIVETGSQNVLAHVLNGTNLCTRRLYTSAEKDYWLLFEPEKLGVLLQEPEVRQYLRECGYSLEYGGNELEEALVRLAVRFRSYKQTGGGFPHEMGVFLGYPLGDVKGFVENNGQNFKQSGYWKVYDDVAYANQIFELYARVREKALELCGQGMRIPDIWKSLRTTLAYEF